jgi:hypothetical protein
MKNPEVQCSNDIVGLGVRTGFIRGSGPSVPPCLDEVQIGHRCKMVCRLPKCIARALNLERAVASQRSVDISIIVLTSTAHFLPHGEKKAVIVNSIGFYSHVDPDSDSFLHGREKERESLNGQEGSGQPKNVRPVGCPARDTPTKFWAGPIGGGSSELALYCLPKRHNHCAFPDELNLIRMPNTWTARSLIEVNT